MAERIQSNEKQTRMKKVSVTRHFMYGAMMNNETGLNS